MLAVNSVSDFPQTSPPKKRRRRRKAQKNMMMMMMIIIIIIIEKRNTVSGSLKTILEDMLDSMLLTVHIKYSLVLRK